MTRMKSPDYGGIFLEPHEIKYDEIDPPLRSLIRLMNSQPWVRTYGCCAGNAQHGEGADQKHQFFIGLFVDDKADVLSLLRSWLDEANRLNGPAAIRAEIECVHKHPCGKGSVDGWNAYQVVPLAMPGRKIPSRIQAYTRLIICLERAWEEILEMTESQKQTPLYSS